MLSHVATNDNEGIATFAEKDRPSLLFEKTGIFRQRSESTNFFRRIIWIAMFSHVAAGRFRR
jgi:hypothetical protein